MKISIKHKGNFKHTERYLKRQQSDRRIKSILERYGARGVALLAEATQKDTGEAASSWYYEVNRTRAGYSLSWNNSKMAGDTPLVVLLQYGHGTRSGSFVQGRDFINPAIKPIGETISKAIWKEVMYD